MKKLRHVSVVALGPINSTFSSQAYADLLKVGKMELGPTFGFVPVASNEVVVEKVLQTPGACVQGVLAVETLAGGGIQESLFSLHSLLGDRNQELSVVLGLEKKLHLALMAQPGVSKKYLVGVTAHARALGACQSNLARLGVTQQNPVDSNGEGVARVAYKQNHAQWGAIGPADAAKEYGLEVLDSALEDKPAVTTFLLLQKGKTVSVVGERNRVILVCKLRHEESSLYRLLGLLKTFNLTQLHSIPTGDRTYDFLLELDCPKSQLETWRTVFNCLPQVTIAHRCFGPFAVYK
jgi:prephenate dehydratase